MTTFIVCTLCYFLIGLCVVIAIVRHDKVAWGHWYGPPWHRFIMQGFVLCSFWPLIVFVMIMDMTLRD